MNCVCDKFLLLASDTLYSHPLHVSVPQCNLHTRNEEQNPQTFQPELLNSDWPTSQEQPLTGRRTQLRPLGIASGRLATMLTITIITEDIWCWISLYGFISKKTLQFFLQTIVLLLAGKSKSLMQCFGYI